MWVVKLNSMGEIDWQKCLGGSNGDEAYSIQQTTDGGYIVAGYTEFYDDDVIANHGVSDIWIVKLSSTGEIDWQKYFVGSNMDEGESILETTDGGYIVAGTTKSDDADVIANHGDDDIDPKIVVLG